MILILSYTIQTLFQEKEKRTLTLILLSFLTSTYMSLDLNKQQHLPGDMMTGESRFILIELVTPSSTMVKKVIHLLLLTYLLDITFLLI